jgi:hypothetical protein
MRGLLTGVPPRATAALDEITSFVGDGRTQMLFATLLWAAAAGMVIWFTSAFAVAIRERLPAAAPMTLSQT